MIGTICYSPVYTSSTFKKLEAVKQQRKTTASHAHKRHQQGNGNPFSSCLGIPQYFNSANLFSTIKNLKKINLK